MMYFELLLNNLRTWHRCIWDKSKSTFANLTTEKNVAASDAVVLVARVLNPGCVLGVTCNKTICHLPFP